MYRTSTPTHFFQPTLHTSHLHVTPHGCTPFPAARNTLQLYTVSSDDFSVHLKIGNYRNGFINGSTFEHAPIFWSKLFFYDSPGNWSSRIVLINPPESLQGDTCETRIGVEPLTGQIMSDPYSLCTSRVAPTEASLLLQVRSQAHADEFIRVCCQRRSIVVHEIQQQNIPWPQPH